MQSANSKIDFLEVRRGNAEDHCGEIAIAEKDFWSTPFQWPSWLRAWQHYLGGQADANLFTAIGYCAGQPVFILPLAVSKRLGAQVLTSRGYQQSDYTAPIVGKLHLDSFAHADGASILREIAGRIGNIDLIYLPKQPSVLEDVANPFVLADAVPYHAGAHAIDFVAGETWEQSLQRRRSSKTRRRLKEKRAALAKLGQVSFRVAKNEEEARNLVGICLRAKTEQLMKLGHWDPFSPPGVRDFLTDYFSANVTQSSWAVSLDVDGRPVVTAFGFRDSEQWLLYQMAMSGGPESRHSPGTHLLMNLMQHCIEQGVSRLDLGLGDESYKAEWCDEDIALQISAIGLTARGKVLKKGLMLRARLRSRMAADPRLYERAKWLKGIAQKFWLPV